MPTSPAGQPHRGEPGPLARADVRRPPEAEWRTRRCGIFEGLPRLAYQRTGRRYITACAVGTVLHGVAVWVFGLGIVLLYVDVDARELALYASCSLVGYVAEGALAAWHVQRIGAAVRAWLSESDGHDEAGRAWSAAAGLPLALLRRRDLYLVGAVGAGAADLLLTASLDLPVTDALWLLPISALLYLSSAVLRYVGLELGMRPILEAVGDGLPTPSRPAPSVSLHWRLVAAVPTVTWATGAIVAGLLTVDTRHLDEIGRASLISLVVAAAVSVWLSLVLADAVSGPIVDLRDATRRIATGDLTVRVPVVSTDEIGQLTDSFNVAVAGLHERERLRDALGVLVDPDLADRVLTEGTDLQGEEVDATILFLDVRDFTAFAETAAPRDVVTALNTLYELVVPVILKHGGHANRFLGDGLLAVFGTPTHHADHARRAVTAAAEIAQVMQQASDLGLRVGIGVNTGRVVVGTIGGGGRRDFTVIGDTVNTAARVEALTREGSDDVLITASTWSALPASCRCDYEQRPAVALKGKSASVRLYARRPTVASQEH